MIAEMIMGICHINKICNAGTIPLGQRFLARQIPRVRGSQLDFTLNDMETSVFQFLRHCGWVALTAILSNVNDKSP